MPLTDDLRFTIEVARAAGEIARSFYGRVDRLTKTHATTTAEAVTEADRATQRLVVQRLRERFPTDGIIGEENDAGDAITFDCRDPMGRNWVIDPIDGTNNYVAGIGIFSVCIGLLDKGEPVLGVVYDVTRDQMYAAAKGQGAFLDGRPIHAPTSPLSESSMIMMTSNLLDGNGGCPNWAQRWIGQTIWKIRVFGSAALEAVQVAAGVAHGAVTVNGKLWDCVAPAAIVREAGGLVTDLAGEPIFPFDLRNYAGKKVPYLAAGPAAQRDLLNEFVK